MLRSVQVQFMKTNGTWRDTQFHENNLKKQYRLYKTSKYFDYYISDITDIIYRIKKSYMKKVHVLLSEQSWNELEDIRKMCFSQDFVPKSYNIYLAEEKVKPTFVYISWRIKNRLKQSFLVGAKQKVITE